MIVDRFGASECEKLADWLEQVLGAEVDRTRMSPCGQVGGECGVIAAAALAEYLHKLTLDIEAPPLTHDKIIDAYEYLKMKRSPHDPAWHARETRPSVPGAKPPTHWLCGLEIEELVRWLAPSTPSVRWPILDFAGAVRHMQASLIHALSAGVSSHPHALICNTTTMVNESDVHRGRHW